MSFAHAADGTALYYEVNGRGDDVLVLLAGQSNNHHWWDAPRPDFDARFRTVVFDHRGTGRSDKPESGYATRTFAQDVVAILDDLGVARAHVYGTSMGGRVAQWLAADHPERVGRLILGCTSPGLPHGVERSAEIRRSLAQRDAAKARQALLELMYTPDWLATHTGPFTTIGDPGMPPHAKRGHFLASKEHDGWDACAKITAPTLVVHGADDVFNPTANAALLAERIPDARMSISVGLPRSARRSRACTRCLPSLRCSARSLRSRRLRCSLSPDTGGPLIPKARHAYFEEFRDVAGPLVLDFLTAP